MRTTVPSSASELTVNTLSLVCQDCVSGPFSKNIFQKTISGEWATLRTTWSKVITSADQGCPFCLLLLSERDEGLPLDHVDNIGSVEDECIYDYIVQRITTFTFTDAIGIGAYGSGWTPSDLRILSIRLQNYEVLEHSGYIMYTSPDDPAATEVIARHPIGNVGGPDALHMASELLRDCLSNHKECPKPDRITALPTRLIDCSNPEQPHLVTTNGEYGIYAALSYVWGGTQPNKTVTSNLNSYLNLIDVALIPKTIHDAIKSVHTFDLKYLWVDAFCIVQDDKQDKRREIAQMRRIFADAHVTIVASSAPTSDSGFLQDRPSHYEKDTRLPFICSDGRFGTVRLYPMSRNLEYNIEPVDQRAWCLEERLLSPRKFVYTEQTLEYHCRTDRYRIGNAILGPRTATQMPNIMFGTASDIAETTSKWSASDWEEIHWVWTDIIRSYTSRDVTNADDKLLALSGLAQVFHQFWRKGRYLAGLWEENMPYELCWFNNRVDTTSVTYPRPEIYLAPSWSWASITGIVRTPTIHRFLRPLYVATMKQKSTIDHCEVLGCDVVPEHETLPYGRVVSATLTLSVTMAEIKWANDLPNPHLLVRRDTIPPEFFVNEPDTCKGDCVFLLGIIYVDSAEEVIGPVWVVPILWNQKMQAMAGLFVVKTDCGQYRRIGCWDSDVEELIEGDQPSILSWFNLEHSQRHVIELV
ncbi:hypothetical protein QCA50_009823 [Cerrena zonata]|uniref:Heterokaryon incompatibility domain-containing protein n=1 Tax=Cerrena zonata TaxID=2478898 RepID=A0AAW0G723_9APHY